jgi:hypothetical protein
MIQVKTLAAPSRNRLIGVADERRGFGGASRRDRRQVRQFLDCITRSSLSPASRVRQARLAIESQVVVDARAAQVEVHHQSGPPDSASAFARLIAVVDLPSWGMVLADDVAVVPLAVEKRSAVGPRLPIAGGFVLGRLRGSRP